MRRLGSFLVALSLAACAWGQPDPQELLARSLRPTPFTPIAPPDAKPRYVLKARVYGDRGHARGVLGWQVRFQKQVAAANRVLLGALGVEVEIVSIRTWAREGGQTGLERDLAALAKMDDGKDVDLVIGLVTPLPSLSPTLHDLGYAQELGKHIVLRGLEDAEEHVWMRRALDERPDEERERLYQSRMRHREVLLFLHEVGHVLGALHAWPPAAVMHPRYSHEQGSFAPENLALMGLALEGRTAEAPAGPEVRGRLAAYLRATEWEGWQKEAKAATLGWLDGGARAPAAPPSTHADAADAPLDDGSAFTRAQALLDKGEVETAWELLAPVLDKGADEPALRALACSVSVRKDPSSKAALEWCRRVVEDAPRHPENQVLYAMALQGQGDVAGALEAVRRAEAGIETRPIDDHERLWTMVAQAYQNLDALTWANASASHGDPAVAGRIATHVRAVRKQVGLQKPLRSVSPAEEPDFVGLMRQLHAGLRSRAHDEVAAAAAALAERFPRVGRPHVQVCQQYGHWRRWAQAKRYCKRAIRRAPRAARPHLVLGVAAFAEGKPHAAVRPLERAVKLGPGAKDGWSLLLAAYRATGRNAAARRLVADYQARFSERLK